MSSAEDRKESLSAVNQYVRQVFWIPVLTAEEQALLVVRIERGKTERRKEYPDAVVLADAQAACDRFIEGMQRLVLRIARGWESCFRGMELLDLVQEANCALLDLLERRDLLTLEHVEAAGAATVRYSFLRLLRDRDGLVRVSARMIEEVHRLRREQARLAHELGSVPTYEEMAQVMGMSVERVRRLEANAEREQMIRQVASLDGMVDEDGQPFWEHDFVSMFKLSVETEQKRQEAAAQLVREAIERSLTPWQREVVRCRFGLDQETQGAKQIAERYGVSEKAVNGTGLLARQKLAVSLAVPYAQLCGQPMEAEWYTAGQAAALLNLSLYQFHRVVRQGTIRCLPGGEQGHQARYARADVERLAAAYAEQPA